MKAAWIPPLHIYEHVNIKHGNNRLSDLLAALPDATAITLTGRLFGNGGEKRYTDTPVIRRFTSCAPDTLNWPWRAAMLKTLDRNNGTCRALGPHRPRNPRDGKLEAAKWYNTSERQLPDVFKTKRIFSDYAQRHYALAQLNDYPFGDMQSYLLKADRGRSVHTSDRLGLDYWIERNFSTDQDHSIQNISQTVDEIRD